MHRSLIQTAEDPTGDAAAALAGLLAQLEGAMHHRTDLDVEANYVDSHGQSEVGFGLRDCCVTDPLPG